MIENWNCKFHKIIQIISNLFLSTVTLYFISNRGGVGEGANKHKWKQNIHSQRQSTILSKKKKPKKQQKNRTSQNRERYLVSNIQLKKYSVYPPHNNQMVASYVTTLTIYYYD